MHTEYEATFPNIDKDLMRERLKAKGAVLHRAEFFQSRRVFDLPQGHEIPGGWVRLRDEGEHITLTLKVIAGQSIEAQKELEIHVNDFRQAEELLSALGCRKRSYQENKRELWKMDGVDITLDTWPFLQPFVEVEGPSEQAVQEICKRLDLPYQDALFCSIDKLYALQYGISPDVVTHEIPMLTFAGENPLLRFSTKG